MKTAIFIAVAILLTILVLVFKKPLKEADELITYDLPTVELINNTIREVE